MLPRSGCVAGIDVGFSETRRSSAICRLQWDATSIRWHIRRYRAVDVERREAFREIVGTQALLSVAIDGPLQRGFSPITVYRSAEKMLTRGLAKYIGKPGQSSAPVGRRLNEEANRCAKLMLKTAKIDLAVHGEKIASQCIVEAFPSSFLGLMLDSPLRVPRTGKSDVYFKKLQAQGVLADYLRYFVPDRATQESIATLTNHDDRAAFACALTALAVASNDYCAVGGDDGWIILPPRRFIPSWAWDLLEANAGASCGQLARSR